MFLLFSFLAIIQ